MNISTTSAGKQAVDAMQRALTTTRAALRSLSPRAILGLGFSAFLLYAFPGYMSNDSVVQLIEARTGWFTNPHPPIMAAEWSLLDPLVRGPLLMLLLQGVLFLGGCAGLLRRVMSSRAAAITASLVLLFPPVLTTMAVIWKDSQMAAYLLAGTALLGSERRWHRMVGLGLITLGCAFRYNAFGASVPLVFTLFEWRRGMRWFARYGISLGLAVATVIAAFTLDRVLTRDPSEVTPAYADIVGVLAYSRDRSDAELADLLRGTPLRGTTAIQARARAVFSPRNAWLIDHGEDRMFDHAKNDSEVAALGRAWRTLVVGDWRSYMAYRTAVFSELIGWTDNAPWSPVFNVFLENADQATWINHNATASRLQGYLGEGFSVLAYDTPLFRPYLYIAVALLLLVLCCRDALTFALLGSGLTYELSFFPVGSTPDFRYSHWLITCTCLAAALLFAQRIRRLALPAPKSLA